MNKHVNSEISSQRRQRLYNLPVAKRVLSTWDKRKSIFANARIPNEEMCSNILIFIFTKSDTEKGVSVSDIARRFDLPQSTVSRYLRLLSDLEMLAFVKGNNDLTANLTLPGSALLDELLAKI